VVATGGTRGCSTGVTERDHGTRPAGPTATTAPLPMMTTAAAATINLLRDMRHSPISWHVPVYAGGTVRRCHGEGLFSPPHMHSDCDSGIVDPAPPDAFSRRARRRASSISRAARNCSASLGTVASPALGPEPFRLAIASVFDVGAAAGFVPAAAPIPWPLQA